MKAVDAETMAPARRAGWAQGVLAAAQTARLPLTLGAVLLAAVALRLWGLGHKSLWFDEAYSVYIARQALGEIPRLLRLYDTHPPLYYVLLHLWMGVAGQSEVAVRVPSVVASLAAIGLTYLLGRRLAGEGVGLLAAVLLAASPFQVTAAQEARMYPFLMLFGVGASYALWLALAEGRRRYWMGYVLCLVLALYTHHFAVLLLLAHGVYVLGIHRERQAMRAWLFAVAVVVILYLPLVPMLVTQVSTARAWPNFRPPFGLRAITDMFGMFSFGGGLFGMGTYFRRGSLPLEDRGAILLPFALLLFAGAAGLEGSRRRVFTLTYWLLPVATVALVSFRWNMFYERYFSFVLPAFYVLLAAGVTHLAGFARGKGAHGRCGCRASARGILQPPGPGQRVPGEIHLRLARRGAARGDPGPARRLPPLHPRVCPHPVSVLLQWPAGSGQSQPHARARGACAGAAVRRRCGPSHSHRAAARADVDCRDDPYRLRGPEGDQQTAGSGLP